MLVCVFFLFSLVLVFHALAKSDKTVSNSVLYGLFYEFPTAVSHFLWFIHLKNGGCYKIHVVCVHSQESDQSRTLPNLSICSLHC